MNNTIKQPLDTDKRIVSTKKNLILSLIGASFFTSTLLFLLTIDLYGLTYNVPAFLLIITTFVIWGLKVYVRISNINQLETSLCYQAISLLFSSINLIITALILIHRDLSVSVTICGLLIVGIYLCIFLIHTAKRIKLTISYTDNIKKELSYDKKAINKKAISFGLLGVAIAKVASAYLSENGNIFVAVVAFLALAYLFELASINSFLELYKNSK